MEAGGVVTERSGSAVLTTAADALHGEEVERTGKFIQIGWALAVLALAALALLPGDRFLAIAMAKRPRDRFPRARELAAALTDALAGRLAAPMATGADALLRAQPWNEDTADREREARKTRAIKS